MRRPELVRGLLLAQLMRNPSSFVRLIVAVVALAAPALAGAQTGPRPVTPAPPGDFLFGRPRAEVGIRAGWSLSRGGSDWYDFVTDQLTLNPGDFNALAVASDVGWWLPGPFTAVGGVEFTHTSPGSEYRHLVDNNRLPINQTTRLNVVHATGGIKYAVTDRGRAIGRLAWIPARIAPYLTAGAGATFYQLQQTGDFVDFVDRSVFPAFFKSQGWAPSYYAGGGADVRVLRRMLVSADFRYRRASANLNSTWVDFDPLDLSGARVTVGTSWQF
jgi:opacity protein-like surface antigen